MKHKTRLIATLMAMCLVITLGVIGILAVKTLNMSVGGNITFNAEGLNFKVADGIFETTTGATYPGVNSDSSKLKGFTMNTDTPESAIATEKASWTGLNLTMSSLGDVVLVIKVTNYMTENLVATITPTITGTNINSNMEIQATGATIAKNVEEELKITFHIKDTSINAGLTGTNYTGFAIAVNFAKEGEKAYDVQGNIQQDGAALSNVVMTLKKNGTTLQTATTDLTGLFNFTNLPVGVYDLEVSYNGDTWTESLEVKADGTFSYTFELPNAATPYLTFTLGGITYNIDEDTFLEYSEQISATEWGLPLYKFYETDVYKNNPLPTTKICQGCGEIMNLTLTGNVVGIGNTTGYIGPHTCYAKLPVLSDYIIKNGDNLAFSTTYCDD